jgi:hypothetical protein
LPVRCYVRGDAWVVEQLLDDLIHVHRPAALLAQYV